MNRTFRLLLACTGMLLAASCTKTDTIAPPELSQSRMLEYKIVNVQGDAIAGSINDSDSSITVYLPSYLQLVTLEPEMKVSTGATVTPASGSLIEDLLDVFHEGRDIKYVVTGKSGVKKTYTLKINVQQEPLVLTELSSDTRVRNFNYRTTSGAGLTINIAGTGISENDQLIKLTLVDEAGREYGPLSQLLTGIPNINLLGIYINTANGGAEKELIDNITGSGLFKIRVYCYARVVTMEYPIKITKL